MRTTAPPSNVGFERIFRLDALSGHALERERELRLLRRTQFDRGGNFRLGDALPLAHNFLKRLHNFRQDCACGRGRTTRNRKLRMILLAPMSRHQFFDHAVLSVAIDRWTREEIAQFRGFRVDAPKVGELLQRRLGRALRQSDIRKRVGILEARGLQFGLPARPLTKALTSASCACGVSCFASSDSAPSTARLAAMCFQFEARGTLGGFDFGGRCDSDFLRVALRYVADALRFRWRFALRCGAELRNFVLQVRQFLLGFAELPVGLGFRCGRFRDRGADGVRVSMEFWRQNSCRTARSAHRPPIRS